MHAVFQGVKRRLIYLRSRQTGACVTIRSYRRRCNGYRNCPNADALFGLATLRTGPIVMLLSMSFGKVGSRIHWYRVRFETFVQSDHRCRKNGWTPTLPVGSFSARASRVYERAPQVWMAEGSRVVVVRFPQLCEGRSHPRAAAVGSITSWVGGRLGR